MNKPPVQNSQTKSRGFPLLAISSRLLRNIPKPKKTSVFASRLLLGFFVFVICYYGFPREQVYVVSANTKSLVVETDRNNELQWTLSRATVCIPKIKTGNEFSEQSVLETIEALEQNKQKPESEINNVSCDPTAFEILGPIENAIVTWPEGMLINLKIDSDATIQMEIVNKQKSVEFSIADRLVPDHSLLFVPASTFETHGTLVLSGKISLGQNMTVGSLHPLQSGEYEIRERLSMLGWTGSYNLVGKDTLVIGDKVSVKNVGNRTSVNGRVFFTRSGERPDVLSAIMTTQPARSTLNIQRGDLSGDIEPGWFSRVQTDAWPAVLTTLLGLLGAALGIVQSFRNTE